jgi:hypothetical protein
LRYRSLQMAADCQDTYKDGVLDDLTFPESLAGRAHDVSLRFNRK